MTYSLKDIGKRLFSFLLAVILTLGLVPVLQKDADALYSSDNNFRLSFYPLYGNAGADKEGAGNATTYRKGARIDTSFAGSVMYNASKKIVWEDSFTGFIAMANVEKSAYAMYKAEDIDVYITWVIRDKKEDTSVPKLNAYEAYIKNTGSFAKASEQKIAFNDVTDMSRNQIAYVAASFVEKKTGKEVRSLGPLSVDMAHAGKASGTAIRYKGIGFQIMAVDDHPLGKYDYLAAQGNPAVKATSLNKAYGKGGNGLYVDTESMPTSTSYMALSNVESKRSSGVMIDTGLKQDTLYHIMTTGSNDSSVYSVISFSQDELESFYKWVNTVYLQAPELKGVSEQIIKGNTITLHGPRIICCYKGEGGISKDNDATTKYYNLQWYDKKGKEKTNPNSYVEWSSATKDGFADWRYVTFTVPSENMMSLTVNCYDITKCKDGKTSPDALIYTKTVNSGESKFVNDEQLGVRLANITGPRDWAYESVGTPENFISDIHSMVQCAKVFKAKTVSEAIVNPRYDEIEGLAFDFVKKGAVALFEESDGSTRKATEDERAYQAAHEFFVKIICAGEKGAFTTLSSLDIDKEWKNSVASKVSLATAKQALSMFAYVETDIPSTEFLKSKVGGKEYNFDHGILYDCGTGVTGKSSGIPARMHATPIMPDTTKVTALGTTIGRSASLDLFYSPNGKGQYTVKVKIDGVEQPDLERVYNAAIDTVIQKEDVVVPELPEGIEVKNIENVPMTIDETPEDNIIIINAGSDEEAVLTVYFYLDGVLQSDSTQTLNVCVGEVVTSAPGPTGSKWTYAVYDYETGTPMTIKKGENIARVYFKSNTPATPAIRTSAELFLDSKYTKKAPNSYPSGYGFYARFYVDVPSWLGQAVINGETTNTPTTWSYSVLIKCGTAGASATYNLYRNIQWSATASWTDGLKGGKVSESGRSVNNVALTLDKKNSTKTRLVFILPINTNSSKKNDEARKAYIPVGQKDKSTWKIDFNFTCNYERNEPLINYMTGRICPGHKTKTGRTVYCGPFWYNFRNNYVPKNINNSGRATITVNGNMYQDDFTSDKK